VGLLLPIIKVLNKDISMPATSKSQQRLFSMALAVRRGDLKRSDVYKSVLDIVDSNMTDKEIEEFTVLKENNKHTMRSLFDYIVEASLDAKKQFIKDQVEELDHETINKIYNIINSVSPQAKQQIDSFMEGVGLTFIQDNILNIFEKNDDLINYLRYISSGKMMKIKTIVDKKNGNIFDICEKNTPISRPTLQRLAREKSTSTGVQVGEYEFLLRLMVDNASETITCKRGDVTADGIVVEVKSGEPRITGASTKPAETIRSTLNKMLHDKYGNQAPVISNKDFNGNGGMKVPGRFFEGLYDILVEMDKNAKESLTEIFTHSYISQWPEDMVQYEGIMKSFVSKHLFSGNDIDTKAVNNIVATICLFCYSGSEDFDRFLVFNKTTGDFACVDTSNKNGRLLETIYNEFASDRFHIHAMQNELNNFTGKGIQFSLK
jgi:hypothetical protein